MFSSRNNAKKLSVRFVGDVVIFIRGISVTCKMKGNKTERKIMLNEAKVANASKRLPPTNSLDKLQDLCLSAAAAGRHVFYHSAAQLACSLCQGIIRFRSSAMFSVEMGKRKFAVFCSIRG